MYKTKIEWNTRQASGPDGPFVDSYRSMPVAALSQFGAPTCTFHRDLVHTQLGDLVIKVAF